MADPLSLKNRRWQVFVLHRAMVLDFAFKAQRLKPFLNRNPVLRNMNRVSRKFFRALPQQGQKKPGETVTGLGGSWSDQPKFFSAKDQFTSLSKKVSTNLGRMLR